MSGDALWLGGAANAGARALRQALEEARARPDEDAFARERVWPRVEAPWWDRSGKLVAPAGSGGGWLAPLLAGAGVAIAAATAALMSASWLRSGEMAVVARPGPWADRAALPISPLPSAAVPLTTGPDERIRHRLARGVEVELRPRTALVPGDAERPPEVRVGRVRFSVPHQLLPGRRYRVRAGAYQIVVLGTTFDVAVESSGVSVEVESGTVEVQEVATDRVLQRLSAGSSWSSEAPAPRAAPRRRTRPRRAVRALPRPTALALREEGAPAAADDQVALVVPLEHP
jgi:ferric-dicitrate binding protein FerR (iron transport regulator)